MHGHAHEPLGSVIMIFCRLNLNRYRRIVNQTLMLPNTSLVPACGKSIREYNQKNRAGVVRW